MDKRNFSQCNPIGGVLVNNLGDVSTEALGGFSMDDNLRYEYFEVGPLKITLKDAMMRSRFEAELRNDPIVPKRDIQPDLLAALYGESSDWHFALCHWTPAFVIFHLANKERLKREYPTDDDLRHLVLRNYKYGLVELCIPVYCLDISDADPLEFAVNVTAETGAYQSLKALAYPQNSFIEAIPRTTNKSKLYRLSYEAQQQIDEKYDGVRYMEEEG